MNTTVTGRGTGTLGILALTIAVAMAGAGCKKKGQEASAPRKESLSLTAAAAARGGLVAQVTIANAEGSLKRVGAVAKKLALPFAEADARRSLLAQTKAPEGVVSRLDLGKPIGLAVVVTGAAGKGDAGAKPETTVVVAGALRDTSPGAADAFVAAVGRTAERRKDAVRVVPGDAGAGAAVWLLFRDGAVLASDSFEGLVAGGALALEASAGKRSEDVFATLLPEGMARAAGTTVGEALSLAKQELAKSQAQSRQMLGTAKTDPKLQAAGDELLAKIFDVMFEAAAGTTAIDLGLRLDETKGLTFHSRLAARAGTPLARWTPRPYTVPPGLLTATPPASFMAMSDFPMRDQIKPLVSGALEAVLSPEERTQATASIDLFMNALAGPWAVSTDMVDGPGLPFTYEVSYDLKPGTDGKALLASMEETVKAPWLGKLLGAMVAGSGLGGFKITGKRDGDAFVSTFALDTKKLPKETRAALASMPMFDGKPIETRTAVVDNRLVMSMGPDSKARLARLRQAAGAPVAPAGALAAALGETKGADAIFYTDFAAFLRMSLKMVARNPMLGSSGAPGGPNPAAMLGMAEMLLGDASIVFYGAMKGDKEGITYDTRAPMSTLESIAKTARQAMGMFGAGQGGAPPPM